MLKMCPNQQAKRKKNEKEQNAPKLWDNHNKCDTHIMGISGGEERKKRIGKIFKAIMTKNFSKLMIDTKPQIQEPQRISNRMNTKKYTPRHIIFNATEN